MRKSISVCLSVLCSACTSVSTPYVGYEGKPLSPSEQSVIFGKLGPKTGIWPQHTEATLISCLDGAYLESYLGFGLKYPDKVLVKPGRHYLTAFYFRDRMYTYGSLWVDAEAGREYVFNSQVIGRSIRIWLEDAATGVRVGGIPGGEPNPDPSAKRC